MSLRLFMQSQVPPYAFSGLCPDCTHGELCELVRRFIFEAGDEAFAQLLDQPFFTVCLVQKQFSNIRILTQDFIL